MSPQTLKTERPDLEYAKGRESPAPAKAVFEWVRGELLGKGSYGRVYLALNATTGEIMAVKQVELPRTASEQSDTRQREVIDALKFESDTLKDLDHPHIVQYLGFEQSAEFMSIFLEYVPGGSVGSCLHNHGPFSEDVTKSFTTQILNGLEYLHSKGIIHRDLKADNILVEPTGICKISDFGISKKAEEASTGMKGTIFWMAPEVVGPSKTKYSSKVDIWSLGCVVLEMWSGMRPWHGEETIPVMLKLFRDKRAPPIPPTIHLSDLAEDLRRKCFSIDPKTRPSAAELGKHPYLALTSGWTFNPAEIEGGKRPTFRSISKPSDRGTGRVLPTVPQGKLPDPYEPSPTIRPYQPIATITNSSPSPPISDIQSLQISNGTDPSSTYRPISNAPPPPIVFITPPTSPMRQSHDRLPNISPPNSESARSTTTRRRSFRVVNPDPDEDDALSQYRPRPKPYVYNPPPLPNTQSGPLPQRLTTSQSMSHLSSVAQPQHVRSHSQSASASTSTTHLARQFRSHYDSDSDSDDGGTGLWNKPPVDFAKIDVGDSHRKSRRISRIESKRDSAWARPFIEDVYQHMDEFFPDHDIDEPILGAGPAETNRAKRKTIRMVAQERLQGDRAARVRRRGTKLWGSRTHEVKAPDSP